MSLNPDSTGSKWDIGEWPLYEWLAYLQTNRYDIELAQNTQYWRRNESNETATDDVRHSANEASQAPTKTLIHRDEIRDVWLVV